MRKLFTVLSISAVLCLCLSSPSSACNQRCNWVSGACETVGYQTGMACETWSGACIDVPVDCRGGGLANADDGAAMIAALLQQQENLTLADPLPRMSLAGSVVVSGGANTLQ